MEKKSDFYEIENGRKEINSADNQPHLIDEHRTIHLTLEDDTEVECSVLTIFPVDDQQYIALLPLDQDGQNTEGEVYLYRFSLSDDQQPILENIPDEQEYQDAARAFDQVVEKLSQE